MFSKRTGQKILLDKNKLYGILIFVRKSFENAFLILSKSIKKCHGPLTRNLVRGNVAFIFIYGERKYETEVLVV
jgi:hypothetical protein